MVSRNVLEFHRLAYMSETSLLKEIHLAVSTTTTRLFRNNCGRLRSSDGQWVQFGLCPGSSDLIGFKSVKVTPEMVGQRVAIFAALEVKSTKGRATPEQWNFIDTVATYGGLAGVVRSLEEARQVLNIADDKATLP